jgi:predicted butyrate kinase (DUF1464 family)
MGWHAAGALDGEVAFLSGRISKASLFQGGASSVIKEHPGWASLAVRAYLEGAVKAVRELWHCAPSADEILLSGRKANEPEIQERLAADLADVGPVRFLSGFAASAKQAAQGAALLADGLAGGRHRELVDRLRVREARGTVLDHLVFISAAAARRRLGIPVYD